MIGVHAYKGIFKSFFHLVDRGSTPFKKIGEMEYLPQMGALT